MFRVSDHHQMLQCQPRPSLDMDRLCWSTNTSSSKVVAPNCPRCASSNTKFCYYNNYSLSQPRYFCKACRRYWTRGGSLRNVPVGGGCRKNRRSKAARQPTTTRSSSPDFATSDPSSSESPNRPTGTDIDVAAVFANFLNHNSGTEFVGGMGSELADESNPFLDFTQQGDDQFIIGIPQIEQEQEQVGGFMLGHDPNCFGLETMLSDELLAQDLVWSDDSNPPTLPNFGWEQVGQFQELGQVLSASDDNSKVSPAVISDNWNLFDLPSYEIFSRP